MELQGLNFFVDAIVPSTVMLYNSLYPESDGFSLHPTPLYPFTGKQSV